MKRLARVLVLPAVLLLLGTSLWAQGSGELTGLITDSQGAAVPRLTITLTNTATGIVLTTQTSTAGTYRFAALPVVGSYTLTVEAKGFRTAKIQNIIVSTGTKNTVDVRLEVGGASETINVEGGEQLVQTSESSVSQLIPRDTWQTMPLAIRNQNSFIELVAGAVPQTGSGSNRGAEVNGTRSGAANYLVDGMDNNDQGQGGRGQLGGDMGGAVTSISPEAIQEYRVITNSFSAEYGRGGGFVTDTVLKSGTNQLHGSLFEYNRVQALAANNFFSNRSEDPLNPGKNQKDRLVRNQFGGSIGGPVIKDKTFFYTSAELHRMRTATPSTTTGTTQAFLDWVNSGGLQKWAESNPNGICMQYNGAACPGAFAQVAKLGGIFNQLRSTQPFPLAPSKPCSAGGDCVGQGVYTEGLTYPVPVYGTVTVSDPEALNNYRISAKVDHKFGNNDQFHMIYLLQDADDTSAYDGNVSGGNLIGPASIQQGRNQNTGVTWDHSFSPTVLNTLKFSYLRHTTDFPAPAGTQGIPMLVTNDALGVGFGMYSGNPQFFTDNQFQLQDSIAFVRGKHSFKAGMEYKRTRNGSRFYNDFYGTFYPNSVEDLVTDLYFDDLVAKAIEDKAPAGSAYKASAAVNPVTGGLPEVYRGYRANEWSAYFQDDWRISSRLTVNLGLRWEYFGPPHNFRSGIDSNFYFGPATTPIVTKSTNPFFPSTNGFSATLATGSMQQKNSDIWNKDTNNFGPRVGFSYDVLGNQKLVLRAGGGVMYDRIYNNAFENIRFNPPFFSDNQIGATVNGTPVGALYTPGLYAVPFSANAAFAKGFAAVPNPRHMSQYLVAPYYEQAHFGVQWEFAHGFVFQPEYIGTFGHKLLSFSDINTFNGRTACSSKRAVCTAAGYTTFASVRPNTTIGADNYRGNADSSNYHALQLTVRKAVSHGLQFNSNFTWSKTLDDFSDMFLNKAGDHPGDNMNPKYDYGPADFNIKARWVTSLSYQLPFMEQNRWVGGWGVNTIISLQSGHPFSPYSGSTNYDANKDGYYLDRVVPKGVSGMSTVLSSPAYNFTDGFGANVTWLDKSKWTTYTCPASVNNGLWCSVPIGRNSMVGPAFSKVDLGVNKSFKINERVKLQFQANMFNLFNHPNFGNPTTNLNSATFGQITSAGDARQTQLALRLDF